ncbi:hypothetical protein CMI37_19950 [Candidatus Pacearchaeota archaeon]|nr:hypothetical protein [Candidatus Pacearchaeota archaeon]
MVKVIVKVGSLRLDGMTYNAGDQVDLSEDKATHLGNSIEVVPEVKTATPKRKPTQKKKLRRRK